MTNTYEQKIEQIFHFSKEYLLLNNSKEPDL